MCIFFCSRRGTSNDLLRAQPLSKCWWNIIELLCDSLIRRSENIIEETNMPKYLKKILQEPEPSNGRTFQAPRSTLLSTERLEGSLRRISPWLVANAFEAAFVVVFKNFSSFLSWFIVSVCSDSLVECRACLLHIHLYRRTLQARKFVSAAFKTAWNVQNSMIPDPYSAHNSLTRAL